MRPIGVTLIALLDWLRAFLFALGGLALIGVGHLSAVGFGGRHRLDLREVDLVPGKEPWRRRLTDRGGFRGCGTWTLVFEELGTK